MSMMKIALQNFKSSFKNYLAIIISLSFTILVFLNFQNIVYSDIFNGLGEHNKEFIDIIIQAISFVLGCFMFFFLWYATNVFLTKRKKEIGIYIFMGLTNQKIGKLYMIETTIIGISALILGVGFGVLTTQLFQMILAAISEITVDIGFRISLKPILITAGIYLVMYMIFVIKGYVNIVRSSVLDMVSAAKQNEYVKQKSEILVIKTILGIGILSAGYYYAVREGGQEVMGYVLLAVVLVVIGVYLLFGGFLPVLFQNLAKKKTFLYQKQRNLWVNNVIFRMKKNYRTYAITCVLMLCSVTALATGFAMKVRYDKMVHFENTYTYQVLSNQADLDEKIEKLIEKDNKIAYQTGASVLNLDASLIDTRFQNRTYNILSYSQVEKLAKQGGMKFELPEPKEDEIIDLTHPYLLSLLTDRSHTTVTINGKTYQQILESNEPYLGYFQEILSFYIVNDKEYQQLLPLGEELYTYNYRIEDLSRFQASREALSEIVSNTEDNYTAMAAPDPDSSDIDWIKVLYTVCIFMFMVFILASGSILFMKLYNDAFEEKERYQILRKLGISGNTLKKSLSNELKTAYAMPFLVMLISSYFSIHALEKMMYESLKQIWLISVAVIFVFFFLCYRLSVSVSAKNAGVE